jgi:hypothetical protein
MWLILGPPTCECTQCIKERGKDRVMLNEWTDLRAGDEFPSTTKAVRAMNRSLNTLAGENADQFVALWYQQGEPVMGRIWNNNGKIAASFSWGGHEYRNNIGSIQVFLGVFSGNTLGNLGALRIARKGPRIRLRLAQFYRGGKL